MNSPYLNHLSVFLPLAYSNQRMLTVTPASYGLANGLAMLSFLPQH